MFALGVPTGAALAQDSATTTPEAQATKTRAAETTTLQAVVVTATKRVEDAKKVPVSLTVITPQQLEAFGQAGDSVLQLASRAPSLYAETSYGRIYPRFYIRGLGNSNFDLNSDQPVSMVYDGVVQSNPMLQSFPLFDIAQVEVLRGPQGTLFGRNSPAGAITFESVKPSQVAGGYARASYGQLGTANAELAYGGPLSAHWSARASVLGQHRDGWIDNTFTNEKDALGHYNDRAVRLQALYENGDFNALINVHGRWLQGTATVNRANAITPGSNKFVPGFQRDKVAHDGLNQQRLFSWGSNVHLEKDLGDYQFTSITGLERATVFSRADVDGGFGAGFNPPMGPGFIPFPVETADAMPHDRQITQEFRLASDTQDPLQWLVGTYYFNESVEISNFNYATFNNHALDGYADQNQHTKSWALFGSTSYQLADDLQLRAGARYSHDSRDFRVERTLSPAGGGPLYLTAQPHNAEWSGDVAATWTLNPNVNVYARVANGFLATGVQARVLFSDSISQAKPETIVSYELGIKTTSLNDHLRFNADVYTYKMHDQQLTAVGGAFNGTELINASRTEGYGAEFDLIANLTENLVVTAGGSYNHTALKDRNLAVAPCGSNCTVLDPINADGNALVYGNPLPNAPKWVGHSTARYGILYGSSGEFFVATDWSYRSQVNFLIYESAEFKGRALLEGGLQVGYDWDNGDRTVQLYGRNITNTQRLTGGIDFNNLTGFVNDPRVWGVEFRANF